jgi:hypothetical protein
MLVLRRGMSALGHKQTRAPQQLMSALPLKATIGLLPVQLISTHSFTIDPPFLATVRDNGIAIVVVIDDVHFCTF